jgi:hypothetical protein
MSMRTTVASITLVLSSAILATAQVTPAPAGKPEPGSGGSAAGAYTPPPCTGMFTDVPCGSQFAAWVEQYARDGITSGCAVGMYCPDNPVTRRQMAVFVERAMRGTATWPPMVVNVAAVLNSDGSINSAASGQALLAAVASIPTTGPGMPWTPQPWVVRVGPGRFEVATTVTLPDFVSIEGSGRETTLITSAVSTGTINTGNYSRIANLSVEAQMGSPFTTAIYNDGGYAVLENVHAEAYSNSAIQYVVYNTDSDLEVFNCDLHTSIWSTGYGIINFTALSNYVKVRNSRVYGVQAAIHNPTSYQVDLAYNELEGALENVGGGAFRCFSNHDQNYAAKTCP